MILRNNVSIPHHMQIAQGEIGQTELPGRNANNPRIIEYNKACTYNPEIDEVPWCAFFVNWVLMQAGIARTKSGAALSFLEWGVKTDKPQYGDILVINRGGGKGHVAFYTGERVEDGVTYVGGLGGNQYNNETGKVDTVNITWFKRSDIQEFRTSKTRSNSTTVRAAATGTIFSSATIIYTAYQAIAGGEHALEYIAANAETLIAATITLGTSVYTWWERLRKIKLFNN